MCLAVPGKILDVSAEDPLMPTGRVDFGGAVKEINLAFVPGVSVGQYVLVHVGFAITVIDETEAAQIFRALEEIGGASEEMSEAP